jgi:hypothetical protein
VQEATAVQAALSDLEARAQAVTELNRGAAARTAADAAAAVKIASAGYLAGRA